MSASDAREAIRLAWGAVVAHRLRSVLTVLGIVIGIASVILLTSIGEGTRRYIVDEFTQFGTHIMSITRARRRRAACRGSRRRCASSRSTTPRRLSACAASRSSCRGRTARRPCEAGERGRSVLVFGVTSEMPAMFRFGVRQGRFLPAGRPAPRRPPGGARSQARARALRRGGIRSASASGSAAGVSSSSASWSPRGRSWASTWTTAPTSRWRLPRASSTRTSSRRSTCSSRGDLPVHRIKADVRAGPRDRHDGRRGLHGHDRDRDARRARPGALGREPRGRRDRRRSRSSSARSGS